MVIAGYVLLLALFWRYLGKPLTPIPVLIVGMGVDIALQDTRSGALVASVSDQSVVAGLIALAAQAGASLRGKLGAHAPDAQTLGLVPNAQPPSLACGAAARLRARCA